MIQWLDELKTDDAVNSNVERFRRTSFAKDLEEDRANWRWMSWPRTPESPLRFILRSDQNRRAVFTIDGDGREYGRITDP